MMDKMKENILDAFYILSLSCGNVCKKILCIDEKDLKEKSRELKNLARENGMRGHLITQKFFKAYYDYSIFNNNGQEFLKNPHINGKNVISKECIW